MKRPFIFQLIFLVFCTALPLSVSADIPGRDEDQAAVSIGLLKIPFIQNRGQVADEVAFYARTFGGTLFVTEKGQMVLAIPGKGEGETRLDVIREEVLGGTPVSPRGLEVSPTRVSSIIGNDSARWQTGVPTFNSVHLGEVYEGIDLYLEVYGSSVEKIFTVEPGGDPSAIRIQVEGIEGLSVGEDGTLVVRTSHGEVSYTAPVAYQGTEDDRGDVQVAYVVEGDTYGFELGPYDRERPLVIDPILNATYLGGNMNDQAYSMAFGEYGKIYVTGLTYSPNFPGIDGTSAQSLLNNTGSGADVFIALLDPTLAVINQATYLGGTLVDEPGYGSGGGPTIAVHPISGKIYVTGQTQSIDFPAVSGGYDSTFGGELDAFVARLDPDLTTVEAATYYGGSQMDLGTALTIDPDTGAIFITGRTESADLSGTTGGYQPDPPDASGWDGFVACFTQDLDILAQATYIGGTGIDWPFSMTTGTDDAQTAYGSLYITGETQASNFPATAGGAQEDLSGYSDAFVIRLSMSLVAGQSTYLGGTAEETGYMVKVHPASGDIYVCGATSSFDLPGTAGGAQAAHAGTGWNDAFVSILSPDLGTLDQSTYLGGTNSENNCSFFLEPVSGDVYLAGTTFSSDFPGTTGGIQPDSAGDNDVFVARLNEDLSVLYRATYIGGSSREMTFAIDTPAIGNGLYITGLTWSGDLPGMSDTWSAQPTHGGLTWPDQKDAFVVWLDRTLAAYAPTTQPSSCWDISTVDEGFGPANIAVDGNDNIHLCYAKDRTFLRYAIHPSGPDASWAYTTVDTFPSDDYRLLSCDITVGSDGVVQIAYLLDENWHEIDKNEGRLKYAWGDSTSGFSAIDVSLNCAVGTCSIILDTFNNPHIIYPMYTVNDQGNIDYVGPMYRTGTPGAFDGGEWVAPYFGGTYSGIYNDIQLIGTEEYPSVAFNNFIHRYYNYASTVPQSSINDRQTGSWSEDPAFDFRVPGDYLQYRKIEDQYHVCGINSDFHFMQYNGFILEFPDIYLDIASGPHFMSMEIDNQGLLHLAYSDSPGWLENDLGYMVVDPDLLARINMGTSTDPRWENVPVQKSVIAHNAVETGFEPEIALDSGGMPHIVYMDYDDEEIKYARKLECIGQQLRISPLRWHFRQNVNYLSNYSLRPFFVSNVGSEILSVSSLTLEVSDSDAWEIVDCAAEDSPVPPLELHTPIPAGDSRVFCVQYRGSAEDAYGYVAVESQQDAVMAQIVGVTPESDTGGGCDCAVSSADRSSKGWDSGQAIIFSALILVLLYWRRRRLG